MHDICIYDHFARICCKNTTQNCNYFYKQRTLYYFFSILKCRNGDFYAQIATSDTFFDVFHFRFQSITKKTTTTTNLRSFTETKASDCQICQIFHSVIQIGLTKWTIFNWFVHDAVIHLDFHTVAQIIIQCPQLPVIVLLIFFLSLWQSMDWKIHNSFYRFFFHPPRINKKEESENQKKRICAKSINKFIINDLLMSSSFHVHCPQHTYMTHRYTSGIGKLPKRNRLF